MQTAVFSDWYIVAEYVGPENYEHDQGTSTQTEGIVFDLVLILVGSAISWLAFELYNTRLIQAQLIFFLLSLSLSILAFYALLRALNSPAHSRLAGSLWGALPWNSLQVWQLAFVGFFFIPLEIILSGLLVSFRTGLPVWQAMGTSLVVRVAVLLAYFAVRAPVMEFFLGRS